jgi:hypothetical protein
MIQHDLVEKTGISSQARISQALSDEAGKALKVGMVEKLAAALGWATRLIFVPQGRPRATSPLAGEAYWLPLFWVGLAFTDEKRFPNSIVELIRDTAEADSAVLYNEHAERNVLVCTYYDNAPRLRHPEAMAGISWSSTFPTQVIRQEGITPIRHLDQSSFADRERVLASVAVPFGVSAHRVLFLNYRSERSFSDEYLASLGHAAAFLGSVLDRRRTAKLGGTGSSLTLTTQRLPNVVNLLKRAAERPAEPDFGEQPLDESLARMLKTCIDDHVPPSPYQIRVFATPHPSESSRTADALSLKYPEGAPPDVGDGVIRNVVSKGVTFLSDDVNEVRELQWWEGEKPIREGVRTKLSVPVRSDRIDWGQKWVPVPERTEDSNVTILRPQSGEIKRGEFHTYGAVDLESETPRLLAPDVAIDVGVLCHRLATTLSVVERIRTVFDEASARKLTDTFRAVLDNIKGGKRGDDSVDGGKGVVAGRQDYLSPLCRVAADGALGQDLDRCNVYAFDHVSKGFAIQGHYIRKGIIKENSDFSPEYLLPRKAGNSERIMAYNAEICYFIPDVERDPSVSDATKKMANARSMIGMPYRLSSSFRPEGIIWLASNNIDLPPDYLTAADSRVLRRLRLFATMMAVLGVTLRLEAGSFLKPRNGSEGGGEGGRDPSNGNRK